MKLPAYEINIFVHLKAKITVSSTANIIYTNRITWLCIVNLLQCLKIGHHFHSIKDGFSSIVPKREVMETVAELNNYR
jgi:hypothetical protein